MYIDFLIKKRADISDEEFIHRWTVEHKKVALETQSTFAYIRNEVVRALTAEAPSWTGIVEESFSIEALRDPRVWYDARSDEEFERNLKRMMDNVERFLDAGPLETTPMSEYLLD